MTPMQHVIERIEQLGLSRFDALVGSVVLLLIAAISLTLLSGDRVGVQIVRAAPTQDAHSTEAIVVQFSETMHRESVAERLRIAPPITGDITWQGDTLVFTPAQPLQPARTYTVTIAAGAESVNGRALLADYAFSIEVRTPQVAYLAPATQPVQQIFIADPNQPATARPISDSPGGVYDFAVNPDGTRIAFSQYDVSASTLNLYLLDIETGTTQQLTECQPAECVSPVWRPDGRAIAYQRDDVMANTTRVWLVELADEAFNNRPLFDDPQIVGYAPAWSADGRRISLYDTHARGLLVHDTADRTTALIPNWSGAAGALSPDGERLVFSTFDPGSVAPIRSYLQIADLTRNTLMALTDLDDAIDDTAAVWHPNGRDLAIARRYMDDRHTRGAQLHLLDSTTGASRPLVVDADYTHGAFSWDATGTQLVYQRSPVALADGTAGIPAVWVYDQATGETIRVAHDAFLPQWVP